MRALVNGVRLFFDVEGAALVPAGPALSRRLTLSGSCAVPSTRTRRWCTSGTAIAGRSTTPARRTPRRAAG